MFLRILQERIPKEENCTSLVLEMTPNHVINGHLAKRLSELSRWRHEGTKFTLTATTLTKTLTPVNQESHNIREFTSIRVCL